MATRQGYALVLSDNETVDDFVMDGVRYTTVYGQSGAYCVDYDAETGEVIRDDRPWQMTV